MMKGLLWMDFTAVAFARMKESKTLFDNKQYHGAIYLIGYAVEVKLKELMQRKKGSYIWDHNLKKLFEQNGFTYRMYRGDPWESLFIDTWDVEMRYRKNDFADLSEEDIQHLYRAAGRLIGKIKRRMV